MGGQGSPNFHRYPRVAAQDRASACCRGRYAPRLTKLFAFLLLLILPDVCFAQANRQQTNDQQANLTLRFAWGGGVPQKWKGSISIEKGSFVSSRPLAISADAPSSVVRRKNLLAIDHRIPTSYGGADVSIVGDQETSFTFSIRTDAGNQLQRTWTLEELTAGVNAPIAQQNRLSISRAPEDEVAIEINRPHLVFDPGETWRLELGPVSYTHLRAPRDQRGSRMPSSA